MTEQRTSNRAENTSREAPPKRPEHAAIELVEQELKRVVGGFYISNTPSSWGKI